MTTPAVVEKQLIDIELKSGHYESERPERSDWTKKLSTAENVILDDQGILKKRPAALLLGDYLDEDGVAFAPNFRFVNYQDSVCHIGTGFKLYHYDESGTKFRKRQRVSEFGVRTTVVGSNARNASGLYTPAADDTNHLTAVAATTKYIVSLYSVDDGGAVPYISVTDRNSGLTVRLYRFANSSALTQQGSLTVVDDRYIHMALTDVAGSAYYKVIDTNSLPSDSAALSYTTTLSGAAPAGSFIQALLPTTNYAILVWYNATGAGTTNIQKMDNSGASVASTTIAAAVPAGSDINATHVFITARSTSTLYRFDIAALGSTTYSLTNFWTASPYYWHVAVDNSGNARIIANHQQISTGQAASGAQFAVYSLAAGGTALTRLGIIHEWGIASHPWYDTTTGRFYLTLTKRRAGQNGSTVTLDTTGACVVADITQGILPSGATNANGRFRPAAVLDTYTAFSMVGETATGGLNAAKCWRDPARCPLQRAFLLGNSTFIGFKSLSTSTSRAYNVAELVTYDTTPIGSTGGIISGGTVSHYDGLEVAELGFVDSPVIWHTQTAGALAAGTRNYLAVYEYVDDDGTVHWSRTSPVSSATNTGAQLNRLEIAAPSVSAHHGNVAYSAAIISRTVCKLYRTTSGGTVYYLVTTLGDAYATPSNTYGTYDDQLSDATLITRPQLHRQPGIANSALDRYYPPACRAIVQHKDRVFVARNSTLYFSSYAVDGEAPWFNPAFSFPVPGGTGEITGLASMDGVLVVFKRDGIWLIDGDGPPENGGNGSEFGTPRRVLTEYGCIDQRTVVATPDGIMYRSSRGFELLTRAFSVADPWVGEAVKDTAALYPYSGGAAFDRAGGRVLFVVGKTAGTYNGQIYGSDEGVVLAYDMAVKAWTIFRHTNGTGTYGYALQDVAFCKLYQSGEPADQVLYLDPTYYVLREDDGTALELDSTSYWVPYKVETAWIRASSLQDRIRVSDFLFLGKKKSNHNLKISVAYDYSDTYSYSKTWTPADISTVEQLELQVPKQAVQAVRFKIEDSVPADTGTYPVTTGKGPEILCLSVKLGLRGGGAKLPSGQKG